MFIRKQNSLYISCALFLLLTSCLFFSCVQPPSPLEEVEENTGHDGADLIPGDYLLSPGSIETNSPAYVNILFNIRKDGTNEAINNLRSDDFIIYDDGQEITSEYDLKVINLQDEIPYEVKTVLLLDNSSSIGSDLATVKSAAKELVDNIEENQSIAIYTFSENASLLQGFTSNTSLLNSAIDSISLGYSTTNLYGSITSCLNDWTDSFSLSGMTTGNLIVFTDGTDTTGVSTLSEVISSRGNKNVYTIGVGQDIDESILEQIATIPENSLTGDYSILSNLFSEIQTSIINYLDSFYWLYYMSPRRGDVQHTLQIELSRNNYSGDYSTISAEYNSSSFYSVMSGLYVNDDASCIKGTQYLFHINESDPVTLKLHSYFGADFPLYSIEYDSLDFNISEVTMDGIEGSVTITPLQSNPDSSIIIRDAPNNYAKSLYTYSSMIISAGLKHSMFVTDAGILWGSGWNQYGQLGDGTTTDRILPVQIMSDVLSVSVGRFFSIILKNDNTLWGCGGNASGQLGDGTTSSRPLPVQIMEDVKMVAAGDDYTMIIKNDNTLWGCGQNYFGQLGDGTTDDRNFPVLVMEDVASVSAGGLHTLILKNDGTLWGCGYNSRGALGDGTNINRSLPIQIMTGVSSVSAGGDHTMIVKEDGSLWGCGGNSYGQLGNGSSASRVPVPEQIMTSVSSVSAGSTNSMIVKTDNTLWGCGLNNYGQLGAGATSSYLEPVQVMTDVFSVAAGYYHTLITTTDGILWGCGHNENGQLADDIVADRKLPFTIKL